MLRPAALVRSKRTCPFHAKLALHGSGWIDGSLRRNVAAMIRLRTLPRLHGCLLWLSIALPCSLGAHADLLIQIEDITKEIAKSPNDAELYVRRGLLRRAHLEYDEAYADYERAAALAPDYKTLDLARGQLFIDAGWPLSARAYLDRFLSRSPNHVDALILRARALTALQLRMAAAADFDHALSLAPEPGPDLFIERAQVLLAEGDGNFTRALEGIDEGIRKLGPLVTLQLTAIEIEMKRKNYDGALARVDRVAERSPRKESWFARKGEILKQAGRPAEARQAYQGALAAMQSLPPARRGVPAMVELEKRLRNEIDTLANSAKP
jgi:tetratricopeptide (TPR) repeat protein